MNGSRLVALSEDTGFPFWTLNTAGSPGLACPAGTVFPDAVALYVTSGNNVSCYKVTYGEFPQAGVLVSGFSGNGQTYVWNNNTVRGRLTYADGMIFGVGSYSSWVSAVNAATGALIWNYSTTTHNPTGFDTFYASPVYDVVNGVPMLFMDTETSTVNPTHSYYALNAKTGAFLWQWTTPGIFTQSCSSAYGLLYCAGGSENGIYALNETTGLLQWNYTAPGIPDYYPMQIGEDRLYVVTAAQTVTGFPVMGSYAGYTICINATTGTEIWRYFTESAATDVSLADGNLYTNTQYFSNSIQAFIWCWGPGPTTTTLAASTTKLNVGDATLLSGSVTDMSPFSQQYSSLQSPDVSGVPVVLSYIASDGTWTDFATATTDSAGQFVYGWTPATAGGYTIVARFEGNGGYYWSSAQTNLIQVDAAAATPTPMPVSEQYFVPAIAGLFVLIVIIFVLVVLALLTLRKRP